MFTITYDDLTNHEYGIEEPGLAEEEAQMIAASLRKAPGIANVTITEEEEEYDEQYELCI
jgi:hypothetical protein